MAQMSMNKVIHGAVRRDLAILTGIFGRGYRKNVAPVWSA
jgi:hypothetical protein